MITGKILKLRGWPEGKIIGLAKAAATQMEADGHERDEILDHLDKVRESPADYLTTPLFADVARETLRRNTVDTSRFDDTLRNEPIAFQTWLRVKR